MKLGNFFKEKFAKFLNFYKNSILLLNSQLDFNYVIKIKSSVLKLFGRLYLTKCQLNLTAVLCIGCQFKILKMNAYLRPLDHPKIKILTFASETLTGY